MSRLNISTNLDTLDNRAGLSGVSQGKTIDEIQKELNKRVPLGKTDTAMRLSRVTAKARLLTRRLEKDTERFKGALWGCITGDQRQCTG